MLRNPVAIVLATYVAYYSMGSVLIGDIFSILLLDTQKIQSNKIWSEGGLCGLFHGWRDLEVILCRLYYPKEAVLLFLIPFSLLALVTWVIQSLAARRFLYALSRRQRWYIILSMYLVATASLIMGLAMLPRLILFTGPIHGFHPLLPLLVNTCGFITPLIFWYMIGKEETRYLPDEKET
jgi:heme/copper-type cytochrome/quinol oxidase subunit 1